MLHPWQWQKTASAHHNKVEERGFSKYLEEFPALEIESDHRNDSITTTSSRFWFQSLVSVECQAINLSGVCGHKFTSPSIHSAKLWVCGIFITESSMVLPSGYAMIAIWSADIRCFPPTSLPHTHNTREIRLHCPAAGCVVLARKLVIILTPVIEWSLLFYLSKHSSLNSKRIKLSFDKIWNVEASLCGHCAGEYQYWKIHGIETTCRWSWQTIQRTIQVFKLTQYSLMKLVIM